MIQKLFITFVIISIFLISISFFKKIALRNMKKNKKEEKIIDLEIDPETNEYRPKE